MRRPPGPGVWPGRQEGSVARPGEGVHSLVRDLRFGFRTLRRRPLFALLVMGTLGLGMGASTTVFSLVDGILLQEMGYERPGELVNV